MSAAAARTPALASAGAAHRSDAGLRVLAASPLTLLVVITLLVTGCGPANTGDRTVTVMFPTSAGLFVGNDVGVLGVRVGSVTAIEPQGTAVQVTLTISDEEVRFPEDVGAAVVARSVAVDRYIELTPVYASGPTLADGATIPVERTATPVEFDEVLRSLKTFSDGLSSDKELGHNIGDLIDASDRALRGQGSSINEAVTALADAVQEVDAQSPTIIGSLRSLTQLTTTLSANETTVRRFIADVADASELLADERFQIDASVTALSRAIDATGRVGRRHSKQLSKDIRQITQVLRATHRSRTDIAEILEVLPLTSQNLMRAVSPRNQFRVQLDPFDLTPIGGPLDRLCPLLNRVCSGLAVPPSLADLLGLPTIDGQRP